MSREERESLIRQACHGLWGESRIVAMVVLLNLSDEALRDTAMKTLRSKRPMKRKLRTKVNRDHNLLVRLTREEYLEVHKRAGRAYKVSKFVRGKILA